MRKTVVREAAFFWGEYSVRAGFATAGNIPYAWSKFINKMITWGLKGTNYTSGVSYRSNRWRENPLQGGASRAKAFTKIFKTISVLRAALPGVLAIDPPSPGLYAPALVVGYY